MIDDIIDNRKIVYGVNTGFGSFATTIIPGDKLA